MEIIMKYNEFKESLKAKGKALREIKIGHKEAQRVLFFNSFDMHGVHRGFVWSGYKNDFTPEQWRRHKLAEDAYVRCLNSCSAATFDYRARHIAYSLFRGKTPEQIENNYYDGKWNKVYIVRDKKIVTLQQDIDSHLEKLRVDNPPKTYYHEFQDVV